MKKIFLAPFLLLTFSPFQTLFSTDCYTTQSESCVEKPANPLPGSVDEFLELREKIGKDPYGGAELFIYALMVRSYNHDLGTKLLVLSMAEENLKKSETGGDYKGYSLNESFLLGQADKVPHCIRSYSSTTKTEDNYQLDPKSVALRFRMQEKYTGSVESGMYKVFVCSTGTDSCRPITLTRNSKGFWKVKEFSSVVVGCRVPQKKSIKEAEDEL
jgi:hypothetical protein